MLGIRLGCTALLALDLFWLQRGESDCVCFPRKSVFIAQPLSFLWQELCSRMRKLALVAVLALRVAIARVAAHACAEKVASRVLVPLPELTRASAVANYARLPLFVIPALHSGAMAHNHSAPSATYETAPV